jgi:ATP-dependent Lon protease
VDNRRKVIRFVAQEVKRDGKIPHFERPAVAEIIRDAQRRAGRRGRLTLRLRELGGLVRVAGDIAVEEKSPVVTVAHVLRAKSMARSLEQQVADQYIERRKEYRQFRTTGGAVGMVNGLAVMGGGDVGEPSGIVMPIVAEVTPAANRAEGKIIVTGKLGEIAKEAVQNISAVIKKFTGQNLNDHDIHVQFIGTYEGVEGDSASISIATAVLSALENVEIDQNVAMTGSLSVRGEVLPIGGATPKIEAAAQVGIKKVIVPKANMNDVLIEERYRSMVEIVYVETLDEVLQHVLMQSAQKKSLVEKLAAILPARLKSPVLDGAAAVGGPPAVGSGSGA